MFPRAFNRCLARPASRIAPPSGNAARALVPRHSDPDRGAAIRAAWETP
jgi:hypothetical protein